MRRESVRELATIEQLAGCSEALRAAAAALAAMHHHPGPAVREATHRGRRIRIETSYRITIDGEPVPGHVVVGNSGRVHYHAIPNEEFASAIDMVKRIVDLTPATQQEG